MIGRRFIELLFILRDTLNRFILLESNYSYSSEPYESASSLGRSKKNYRKLSRHTPRSIVELAPVRPDTARLTELARA